jgi:hypothetical protein
VILDTRLDITGSVSSYGIVSEYAGTLPDLTQAAKNALASGQPRLIEVSQHRLGDS